MTIEEEKAIYIYIYFFFFCGFGVLNVATWELVCILKHSEIQISVLWNVSDTYLLTYSMVQSPSWKANWFAATQEIPRISRNPKVHYRTHKRPPPVPILGHPNPVHILTSHLLEIRPNIIHPSTPRSPQWFLPSGFPTKTLYTPLSSPIRATCPAHLMSVTLRT
jgi:hypothetical protein